MVRRDRFGVCFEDGVHQTGSQVVCEPRGGSHLSAWLQHHGERQPRPQAQLRLAISAVLGQSVDAERKASSAKCRSLPLGFVINF